MISDALATAHDRSADAPDGSRGRVLTGFRPTGDPSTRLHAGNLGTLHAGRDAMGFGVR